MALSPVKERVDNLESLMAELTRNVNNLTRDVDQLHIEMREFKDEMSEFKDEMSEFKDEMREFKDEMREFKDESRDFKTESRKKWGELANKMGTMVEDLVSPSFPRIVRTIIDCPEDTLISAIRIKQRNNEGRLREFDAMAACGNYLFINETKSSLSADDIKTFVTNVLPEARNYFPQHAEKQVIGIIASLYVDDSVVRYGEKQGVVVLGFGEDVMDVLNSSGFTPKFF